MADITCKIADALDAFWDGLLWVVITPFYLGIAVLKLLAWVGFWGTVSFVTYGLLWKGNTLKVEVGNGKVEVGTTSPEPQTSVDELKDWLAKTWGTSDE